MYKIVALIGEAGAGKDTVMQGVLKICPGLHEIVSCTTRPKRDGEVEGVNYFYLSVDEFTNKILNNEMFEATNFNNWFYGTSRESLDETRVNIGVFNPAGVEALMSSPEVDLSIYKIEVTEKNRLLRQLNRESDPDIDEIIRRLKTDREDFYDLDFPVQRIPNNNRDEFDKAVRTIATRL